jgi:oligoribonuclease NrnB/cAMP/cGMP phosphodiesterase (DHH superfamily)
MKTIRRSDSVYNISHNDLDGVGSVIVLSSIFSNLEYTLQSYVKVDDVLRFKTDLCLYDHIIMTDISPDDKSLVTKYPIILLDHHETALSLHDVSAMRFVTTKTCATLLVKRFFEKYFNISLSHLDAFCTLVNDYDLWIHKDPASKKLNMLLDFYKSDMGDYSQFINRFKIGDIVFKDYEMDYIGSREEQYKYEFDNIEVLDLETIKGCLVKNVETINDVADDLLINHGYKIVFVRNRKNNHTSVRHNIDGFNVGKYLTDNNLGGGHAYAGGMNVFDVDMLSKAVIQIERYLEDRFECVRRLRA